MSNWRRKFKRVSVVVVPDPVLTKHNLEQLTYRRPPLTYEVADDGVLVFNVPPGPLVPGRCGVRTLELSGWLYCNLRRGHAGGHEFT